MLSPQTIVVDVLDASPRVASLLLELRVDCIGCSMNRFCTLAEVCNYYDLDIEYLIHKVQERLNSHMY